MRLLVFLFTLLSAITAAVCPGGGRGGQVRGDGREERQPATAPSPILITAPPHHHHHHHHHHNSVNTGGPRGVQSLELPAGGAPAISASGGTQSGISEVGLANAGTHDIRGGGGGGGGGGEGGGGGVGGGEGGGVGGGRDESQRRKTSHLSEASLLHRLKKSMNKKRKTHARWKQQQQQHGGGRAAGVKVVVEGAAGAGLLPHFWRSTGLSPPLPHSSVQPFLLSPDELLNLALVGSLPHDAIAQVRIHWLLDLVNATLIDGSPQYNFTQLDTLVAHLHRHRLRPGFELMGNPGNLFSDLENATQVLWWRLLVEQTAARYVEFFGLDWVSSWRWETWNEPDHHDFDNLNFTEQGFLNYFEACRGGLLKVSPRLRLGGPGGSCRDPSFSRLCWTLLTHCHRQSPARCLDFISVHKKGQEDADSILTQELLTAAMVRSSFPSLRHVPLVNDEGDFLKGWWRGLEWRADSRYAALVARAVSIHLPALSRLRYELLSFDNAFLNYRPSFFDQRTLVARFQINSTSWRHVQLVKKPSYTVMALLSLLGDQTLPHRLHGLDDRLSVIASCRRCRPSAATPLRQGSRSHRGHPGEGQTNDYGAKTNHDLHVYPGDDITPETQAGAPGTTEEEEEGEKAKEKKQEDEEEKEEEGDKEEKEMKEQEEEEEERGTAPANIPSSLLNHKQHDSSLNLRVPLSRRSARSARTHSARKRGSIVDAGAVGDASIAGTGTIYARIRRLLPAQQASHPQHPAAPSSDSVNGETLTAAMNFVASEDAAVFPRPEVSEGEGRGGEDDGPGVEKEERQASREENENNNGKVGNRKINKVEDSNNMCPDEREKEDEEKEDSEATEEGNEGELEEENRNNEEEEEEWQEEEVKEEEEEEEEEGVPRGAAWEAAVMLSLSDDPARYSSPAACRKVEVTMRIPSSLVGGVVLAAIYRLGGKWPGPYEAWLQLGRPEEPTRPQLAFLRAYEDARRHGPRVVSAAPARLVVPVRLCVADVWLLHLCQPSAANPGQVVGVGVVGVTPWDALITWSDERINTRCVLRYEVEHSAAGQGGPYLRVNSRNVTHNNYWFSTPQGQKTVRGWYRVRVVTYWSSAGPYSTPVYHLPGSSSSPSRPLPPQVLPPVPSRTSESKGSEGTERR